MPLTNHARQRMAQRGITEQDIDAVMRRPIRGPLPGSGPGTVVFVGSATGGRMLKVVVSAVDPTIVVSVMWES